MLDFFTMARSRPRTPSPGPTQLSFPALDPLLALAAATLAAIVFHRATHYYFSADDFEGLARARGILPSRAGVARLLPWHLYYPAFFRAFGLDATPYHLGSLIAHAAASALVFAWLRPLTGRWSALLGATFYAVHPAHYGAVYWVAAIGDSLAITFGLLALLLRRRAGPARWLAVPEFALGLLSKESAVLLPLVPWLMPENATEPETPQPRRDPMLWTMAGLATLLVGYYLVADPISTRGPGAEAYLPTLGPHVVTNLLTYAGWTADFFWGALHSISDVVEPAVFPWGIAALAIWSAGAFDAGLRRRGWIAGGVLWIVMLLPVLPLAHHTYRYYLSGPLAGVALCVAALASRLGEIAGRPRSRRAWLLPTVALGAVALLTINGWFVVAAIENAPFTRPGLHADPIVDRALIAQRATESLQQADLPEGVTLRFWSPIARASVGLGDSSDAESYWEKNVRAALNGGLGVRVAFPTVRRVEFVPRFTPAADSVWYVLYREDGSLRAGPASSLEAALRH